MRPEWCHRPAGRTQSFDHCTETSREFRLCWRNGLVVHPNQPLRRTHKNPTITTPVNGQFQWCLFLTCTVRRFQSFIHAITVCRKPSAFTR